MSRIDVHYTDNGYIAHVLVDEAGLVAIRNALGSAVPTAHSPLYSTVYSPFIAPLTGVPIYLDDCPCAEEVSGGA